MRGPLVGLTSTLALALLLTGGAWAEGPVRATATNPDRGGAPLPASSAPDLARLIATDRNREALAAATHRASVVTTDDDRAASWIVVGQLHREAGETGAAVDAFARAASWDTPLAPMAVWWQAEQSLAQADPEEALALCDSLVRRWPAHPHAEDCAQLTPFALARLGRADDALIAAAAWDDAHKHEPIGESVALTLASWELRHQPDRAIPRLRHLAVTFTAPLTGRLARHHLVTLANQGHPDAIVPDDLDARLALARSLRASGQRDAAWAAFATLVADATDRPDLVEALERDAEDFGWSTRRYDLLAQRFRAELDAAGGDDADVAWRLYRALDKGGRPAEALVVGRDALDRFSRSRAWRHQHEVVARTAMFAKDYAAARDLFDVGASSRNADGRRRRFYAAFCAVMLGEVDDALARLAPIVDHDRDLEPAARYWRMRLLSGLDDARANADRSWLLTRAPTDWYGLLAAQHPARAHDGRWPGPLASAPPPPAPQLAGLTLSRPVPRWIAVPGSFASVRPQARPPHVSGLSPEEAARRARDVATSLARVAPTLQAAVALADAGLVDLSGPMVSSWIDDLDGPAEEAWDALDAMDRLAVLVHTADAHHMVRLASRVVDESDPASPRWTLPVVHERPVWRHASRHDVDPYLVLAIMRTESLYDATAVSYAGARGPMQIMPRTGHLLADRTDDLGFTVNALHDPMQAIGYGVRYLGLLLDRFEGAFPLAVASYNGGPHNVSAWLDTLGHDMPMDAFVEHIPFGQTRRYVRKVSSVYGGYVAAWGPEGAGVVIPTRATGDDPGVVDF